MAVSKVIVNGVTRVDMTGDTATADKILQSYTAHIADGTQATGTASGGATLKMGVIRPDAELIETWSDDYYVVDDKGITLPSYSTTSTTLVASADLTPTASLSQTNYRYYVLQRTLVTPEYSINTKDRGRQEYVISSGCYEIHNFIPNTFKAMVDNTYATSRFSSTAGSSFYSYCYWNSASQLSMAAISAYGCNAGTQTPSLANATSNTATLTVKSPALKVNGSTSYFAETFMNALTDIRCQYKIELYRIPIDTDSTYGISGWGLYSQGMHVVGNVNSNGTLT